MQLALLVVGTCSLVMSAVFSALAIHAYVALDIRAVRDDLSGRARRRGLSEAMSAGPGVPGTSPSVPVAGEDAVKTSLGLARDEGGASSVPPAEAKTIVAAIGGRHELARS